MWSSRTFSPVGVWVTSPTLAAAHAPATPDPALFDEFRLLYRAELAAHPEHWQGLLDIARRGTLTLLYAARQEHYNNARVLAEFLEEELDRQGPSSSPVCYADEL